jgi:hypothetical protein
VIDVGLYEAWFGVVCAVRRDPSLSSRELGKAGDCSHTYAMKIRRYWLADPKAVEAELAAAGFEV